MFTVIGPGGKKLEMPAFLAGESKKINFFSSKSTPTETRNFFTQPLSTPNPFQTSSNNTFQTKTGTSNIFSQQPSGLITGNIFGQSNNPFGSELFNHNQPKNTVGPEENEE